MKPAMQVTCPKCGEPPLYPCRALTSHRITDTHVARMNAAWELARRRQENGEQ